VPRYLVRANYTHEGLQGLLQEGGTGRQKAIETLASSLGGQLVSLDYAFGEHDVYAICELPDDERRAPARRAGPAPARGSSSRSPYRSRSWVMR
jgi:uncharacterized protein with GYD domain